MRPSDLRQRVTVKENKGTGGGSAAYYEKSEDWDTVYCRPLACIDQSSRQYWAAKQRHEELTHLLTIAWARSFDVEKELRFEWTDDNGHAHVAYPLGPARNDGNRWLEFHCVEEV